MDEQQARAEGFTRGLVLYHFRLDRDNDEHLRTCGDVSVEHAEAWDGLYGCDTGCEYARLEAHISCPHGHAVDYEYGTFGEVADLVEDYQRTL